MPTRKVKTGLLIALLLIGIAWLVLRGGEFLVVDKPQHADLIVVLAGETEVRPARALQLLRQGYAPRILLDVPANAKVYDLEETQLAEGYIRKEPEAEAIGVCPIVGLSTRDESRDVGECVKADKPKKILIVTSDFHTRRSLSIFRRQLRGIEFSTAAASDPTQFGARWWSRRQWAKTFVDEWLRLIWWRAVDWWR